MKTEPDPKITLVWFLCSDSEGAEIFQTTWEDPRIRMWSAGGRWTSRSSHQGTEQEFREAKGILEDCRGCHSPFATKMWCKPYPQLLTERHLCFNCNIWLHDCLPKKDLPGTAIVDGHFYRFDHEHPVVEDKGQFLGHGGRRFTIVFNDDRIAITNNLWHGGEIPSRFHDQLPNNAQFV